MLRTITVDLYMPRVMLGAFTVDLYKPCVMLGAFTVAFGHICPVSRATKASAYRLAQQSKMVTNGSGRERCQVGRLGNITRRVRGLAS